MKPAIIDFGKYKGTPVLIVPTQYLLWILGSAQLRENRPEMIEAALDVLGGRWLADPAELLADILKPVPWTVVAAAQQRKRKAEQAKRAKLVKLIERHKGTRYDL